MPEKREQLSLLPVTEKPISLFYTANVVKYIDQYTQRRKERSESNLKDFPSIAGRYPLSQIAVSSLLRYKIPLTKSRSQGKLLRANVLSH